MAEMLRLHSRAFGYDPNDIVELMDGFGYCCFASAGDHWRSFERMNDDTVETNFPFLHSERHSEVLSAWSGTLGGLTPPPDSR
jgi:hypothetical protein